MKASLVVLAVDVELKPIPNAEVTVRFLPERTVFGLRTNATGQSPPVPIDNANFWVANIDHPEFAQGVGDCREFHFDDDTPTMTPMRHRVLSVKWWRDASGDVVVEMAIVVPKLRAPTFEVDPGAYRPAMEIQCPADPVVGTGNEGWSKLNALTPTPRVPDLEKEGRFIWLERVAKDPPRLIGVWLPNAVNLRQNKAVDYILYFTPKIIHGDWGTYPNSDKYQELARRYLFREKRLAYHMHHAGVRAIAVVPVTEWHARYHDTVSQYDAYRLLREVNFFLHQDARADLFNEWPQRKVGRVAMAAFSDGTVAPRSILSTPGANASVAREFFDTKLKEVYNLDGPPEEAALFDSKLFGWYRGGGDGRKFRIYTMNFQYLSGDVRTALKRSPSDPDRIVTRTASHGGNVAEGHHPDMKCSIVCLSAGYYHGIDLSPENSADGQSIHQFFPRYYLGHALRHCSFR